MADNSSIDSIESTDSIQQWDGDAPIALSDSQKQPRRSIVRRFSTATSNYFSTKSIDSEDAGPEQRKAEVFLEQENEFQPDDLYGGDQIAKSLSKKTVPDAENHEDETETISSLKKTGTSTSTKSKKKLGFWDDEFKESRAVVYATFASNYFWLVCGFIAALCIYWGSFYGREGRYKNLDFVVINADQAVGELPSMVGATMQAFFEQVPTVQTLGNYDIWDFQKILQLAQQNNNTITEEVYRLIHEYKYWAAFYIHENSTLDWYQALQTSSPDFSTRESFLEIVYETGQDYNAISKYIVTILQSINRVYFNFYPQANLTYNIQSALSSTQLNQVWDNSPSLLTEMPTWWFHDRIPVDDQVYQAPFQLGIIYLVIFAFFQFLFTLKVHAYLATRITGFRYVLTRMLIAQMAYLVISLGFVVLNTAFGLPYNGAFGDLGFLVIWMIALLTMSSLGSLIEILVLLIAGYKQQLIGFVMMFVAILNVTPIISPIVLCPVFYRYGYGAPARASYELLQVAYFDAWKGNVGKNIGILAAWIIGSNMLLPFVLKLVAKNIAKKQQKDSEKEQELVDGAYKEEESQRSKSTRNSVTSHSLENDKIPST